MSGVLSYWGVHDQHASVPLLLGWWLGQAVELGLSGGVIGALATGVPPRRMLLRVTAAVVALFAATVVLQSVGFAPPMQMAR